MTGHSLLPDRHPVLRVDLRSEPQQQPGSVVATEDQALIRQWAKKHSAEPATGEATASGPATVEVQDGGAGIRFNFPAAGRFREISWDEWFDNFTRYNLMFVYQTDTPDAAPSASYQLVPKDQLPE